MNRRAGQGGPYLGKIKLKETTGEHISAIISYRCCQIRTDDLCYSSWAPKVVWISHLSCGLDAFEVPAFWFLLQNTSNLRLHSGEIFHGTIIFGRCKQRQVLQVLCSVLQPTTIVLA